MKRIILFQLTCIILPTFCIGQNVGIGTTSPVNAKLEVHGSVGNAAAIFGNAAVSGISMNINFPEVGYNYYFNGSNKAISPGFAAVTGLNPITGDFYIGNFNGSQSSAPYSDIANYTDRLILKQNGNIGINTTTPNHAKLEVSGRVGATVAMFGADAFGISVSANNPEIGFNYFYNNGTKTIKAGYGANLGMDPGNGNLYIGNFSGNQSPGDFGSISGYQNCMTIKQNGNIGIGTADPTYKLSVNGNIRSKEVVVESGWADYVFDKQYQLPLLTDVKKFIEKNKHLPGIPSANDIKENGLNIGTVQAKMMEKIEELMLYIIEQDKKIKELEMAISRLK